MQTITLSFIDAKTRIPIVNIPLSSGKTISAIIDTGSEVTVYDKGLPERLPEIFLKTALIGKRTIHGMYEKIEMDFRLSKIALEVARENEEGTNLKFLASEHDLSAVLKGLTEERSCPEDLSMLIGSDFLRHFRASIDMRKKAIKLHVLKTKKKKDKTCLEQLSETP